MLLWLGSTVKLLSRETVKRNTDSETTENHEKHRVPGQGQVQDLQEHLQDVQEQLQDHF